MTHYYIVDCDTNLIWIEAVSANQARRVCDELNRDYRKCCFGFRSVFIK